MKAIKRSIAIILLLIICMPTWAQGSLKPAVKTTKQKTTKKLPKNQMILSIDGELGDCAGATPKKCMLVKFPGKVAYELFYDNINGFAYQEGYKYNVLVKVDTLKEGPASTSNLKYTLIKVLSKTVVAKAPLGEIKTLQISDQMSPCEDASGKRNCILAKEPSKKFYELFYEKIEGFNYQEGSEYIIQVQMIPIPGDVGKPMTYRYKLLKIISQKINGTPVSPVSPAVTDIQNFPTIPKTPDSTGLSGKVWKVQLFRADTTAYDVKDLNMSLIIHTDQNRLSGKSACNSYYAGVDYNRTVFKLGPIGTTKMYCSNSMKTEELYFQALQACDNYEILNYMLYLKKGDKILIELK